MSIGAQANWDDLRYVLAVADRGSVAAASRALGVNHATVLRRIAAFETRHGVRVFEKTSSGYRVSPDKRRLVEALREAGAAVGHVERMIEAERPRVSASIRITSTDAFCYSVIPGIVSKLQEETASPISVLSANAHLDFTRLQADLTVRPAMILPDELAGEPAVHFRFGIYASEAGRGDWIGMEGPIAHSVAAKWLRGRLGATEPVLSSDSFLVMAELAASGRGRAILPVFIGDAWPRLRRLELPADIPPTPIWVASHVDLLDSGRLKRVRRRLAEELSALEPSFMQ